MSLLTLGIGVWSQWALGIPTTRKVELIQKFHPVVKSGSVDLFIPLPIRNSDYQKVLVETHESNANWVREKDILFNQGKDKARVLHAHWDQATQPSLELRETMLLSDREGGSVEAKLDGYFLQPTKHVPIDGIVKERALKITHGISDPDQKAKAIYDWIVENTFRDPKTRGCGRGDVKSTLLADNLGGKCADLNSLFVGLARASGLPAREIWGLRVAPSARSSSLGKEGDVSGAHHCRAEYYSAKRKAWVPSDPADIRKVILQEERSLDDSHVKTLRKQLFGSSEGNWVAFNYGRDLRLPEGPEINFLMYPQLMINGTLSSGFESTEIGYTFTSRVLDR